MKIEVSILPMIQAWEKENLDFQNKGVKENG